MDLENKVYGYKTQYPEGFTNKEMKDLLKELPFEINREKFNEALNGVTCQMRGVEVIIYHCDILKAVICGVENRDLNGYEWD